MKTHLLTAFLLLAVALTVSANTAQTMDYNPRYDFDMDGDIDIFDIVDIAGRYRTQGQPEQQSALLRFNVSEATPLHVQQGIVPEWIPASPLYTWTPTDPESNAVVYIYWWCSYETNMTEVPWETYFKIGLNATAGSTDMQMAEYTVRNDFTNNSTPVIEGQRLNANKDFYTFQFFIQGYAANINYSATVRNLNFVICVIDEY